MNLTLAGLPAPLAVLTGAHGCGLSWTLRELEREACAAKRRALWLTSPVASIEESRQASRGLDMEAARAAVGAILPGPGRDIQGPLAATLALLLAAARAGWVVLADDALATLHPAAQVRAVGALRDAARNGGGRVVLATRAAYALDAADWPEVLVLARAADGAIRARPLTEAPEAARWRVCASPGEMWASLPEDGAWVVGGTVERSGTEPDGTGRKTEGT